MSVGISLKDIQAIAAKANEQKAEPGDEIKFDFQHLDKSLNAEWETSARKTLVKMFQTAKLEENFTFKVAPRSADHYINAMRSVLGRVRKKAAKKKLPLEEFKLLVVEVKHEPTHDVVTVVRTKAKSRVSKSVYDDLLGMVTAESEEK